MPDGEDVRSVESVSRERQAVRTTNAGGVPTPASASHRLESERTVREWIRAAQQGLVRWRSAVGALGTVLCLRSRAGCTVLRTGGLPRRCPVMEARRAASR